MTQEPTVDMARLPVQYSRAPAGPPAARARFFNSGNAFNVKLPTVPAAQFTAEATAALAEFLPDETARFIACDQSTAIAAESPATSPLMLARYARLPPGHRLSADMQASGVIWYVIRGAGRTRSGAEDFAWGPGDVFLTPGGAGTKIAAGPAGAVLWLVTDEPLYAFAAMATDTAHRPAPVHYPAAEIARQLQTVVSAKQNDTTSGAALIFSSEACEAGRNILPTLTLSLNTVPAGEHQRAHRHNSAAITLILKGEGAYSMVGGARCDWVPFATIVTPPGDAHSHHNPGDERCLFLIVQDGGLHYRARSMGFVFLEDVA
ncbi:cupin domain-containing protein [Acidisoma sp. 7E03]